MPESVDLSAGTARAAGLAWWDKKHDAKVAWAERRRELTVVIRVPAPKTADIQIDGLLVTCAVTDAEAKTFRIELPMKRAIEQECYQKTIGNTSVRMVFRKQAGSEGLWQDDPGDNNTCLSVEPGRSKAWLAYDWEIYNDDEDDEEEQQQDGDDRGGEEEAQPAEEEEEEEEVVRDGDQQDGEGLQEDKAAELQSELEAVRKAATSRPRRQKQISVQMGQLLSLLGLVAFLCGLVTFLITRWLYSPDCVPPATGGGGEL